jgi:hypothetical protein
MSFDGDSGSVVIPAGGPVPSSAGPVALGDRARQGWVIPGLSEGASYNVRVLAYNRVGYSAPALAAPLGTSLEVQSLVVEEADVAVLARLLEALPNGRTSANFTLTHHDPNTGRYETTSQIPIDASAAEVSDAISGLRNCGPVSARHQPQISLSVGFGGRMAWHRLGMHLLNSHIFLYTLHLNSWARFVLFKKIPFEFLLFRCA